MKPEQVGPFKMGDRVKFDVVGAVSKPFGYGQIVYVDKAGLWRMEPNLKLNGNLQITNVRLETAKD